MHSEYLKKEGNPKSIYYMQVSGQSDWTHLSVYNGSFISINVLNLDEEINKKSERP